MDISTDNSTGIKFGDLKKEERYKRLERDLRLEYFKRLERLKADINKDQCTSPTWPSLSSITTDNLDSSCAHGLQVSKVESEVIASSSNLHKVFPTQKSVERLPMATSSIKHFTIKDYDNDRAIMPPPSTNIISTSTRRLSTLNTKQNEQVESHDSCTKISSATSCSSYQEENFNSLQNFSHSRTFYRWKVLLNAQGQLIIKGILDCGKIARSKPVAHRLSSAIVRSIYKHTYILNGPISDEKEELPDYVRGKFYNGFPDDWENVYQLWTAYVSKGCKETFRWPTPITDSDDDLYSEITDFSCFKSNRIEYIGQDPKIVVNNSSSLGYHSRTQSNNNFNSEKTIVDKFNNENYNKLQVDNISVEDSGHSSEIRDSNICNTEHEVQHVTQEPCANHLSNTNLKNASFLSQIIKEEKLRIIMSNLGNENCSPEYLDKLIELSDLLRYILSYTPDNCGIDCKKKDLSLSRSQIQVCEKCNNSTVSLAESSHEDSLVKLKNKSECIKSDNVNKNFSKINDQAEHSPIIESLKQSNLHNEIESAHNSSDSDSCMGVPHIPINRLIQPKSPRFQRYKDKKNHNRERNDVRKNDQIEVKMIPVSNIKSLQFDDSSISITEDESERKKHEMQDNHFKQPYSKHVNLDTKLRNYEKGSDKLVSNLIEKQKPVIKSCEPVHYKLVTSQKISKPSTIPLDITILSENVAVKANDGLNFKHKNRNENVDKLQEKLQKDILKQPLLSYDSEDYLNEKEAQMQIKLPSTMSSSSDKIKDRKISSIEKNKENSEDMLAKQDNKKKLLTEKNTSLETKNSAMSSKTDQSEAFGSKSNPKSLISWVPYVDYDESNNKLSLQFAGKLLNERGHILHRKFVTNPIVRRHSLKLVETEENEYFMLVGDISDTKHVVPKELLKHCSTGCPAKIKEFCVDWKKFSSGERLVKKETEVTYNPGNMKENVLPLKINRGKKTSPLSEKRTLRSNTKKDTNSKGSMSSKPSKTIGNSSDLEEIHFPMKRRFIQQLTYSSSEDHSPDQKREKFRKSPNEIQLDQLASREIRKEIKKGQESSQKMIKKNLPQQSRMRSSKQTSPKYEWSYDKEDHETDILSDDQVSVMK
ncbi:putative uncharacterized protein DDB_G0282499 isoform X2 [Phymastichus coffea]|uniref:putative uncharacterized protein DDB_G0282499 isoform X2 n=1 Tax=Phymastichus coffea TaxID=108790 RepID=UPI00273BC38D|nr:putative uncharacterized protein DDB_G0282499 isoform X2 [Phymastichus coffea]